MKRKRLILVGNGLDLSLGLKTGYQDFALWFFKEELVKMDSEGKRFPHSVSSDRLTVRDSSGKEGMFLDKYSDFIENLLSLGNLKQLQRDAMKRLGLELLLPHGFYSRLLFCDEWGDIERSYYSCILDIVKKSTTSDEFQLDQYKIQLMISLNKEFNYIRDKLVEYIEQQSERIPELLEEKKQFKSLFSKLLTGKSSINQSVDFVVNFNYTKTIDVILSSQKTGSWVQSINIHGKVGCETGAALPIFGYGDDVDKSYKELEDLNHSEYFKFFKSHYYSRDDNYERMLQFLGESLRPNVPKPIADMYTEFEVHIIGHSCGISDRTMLKTIFEHDNCKAIYNYHWRENEEEARQDHFEKDINVSRHFDDKIKKRARFKPFDFSLRY